MIKTFAIMIATLMVLTSSVSSQEPINATGEGYWLSVQNRAANILQGEAPSGTVFEGEALALVAPPNSELEPIISEEQVATAFTPEPTVIVEGLIEGGAAVRQAEQFGRATIEPGTMATDILEQPEQQAPTRPSNEEVPPEQQPTAVTSEQVEQPEQQAPTRPSNQEVPPEQQPTTVPSEQVEQPEQQAPTRPSNQEVPPEQQPTLVLTEQPAATLEPPVTVQTTNVRERDRDDVIEQTCSAEAVYITPAGQIPVTIEWRATGTNVEGVQWQFHDGTTSSTTTVQFTYDTVGNFPVVLTCTGPLGEIVVNNNVEIYESSGTEVGVFTITPSPTEVGMETSTPTITNTPRPTRTASPTITPGGPTFTPSITRTPRPTNTPSNTPTPETICEIGALPDPNQPGAYQFFITESQNVENVVWQINGQTYYGTEITAVFIESGVYEVTAECVSAYDIIQKNVLIEIEIVTSIEVGEGTAIATFTPTFQAQPPQSSPTPTFVPPTSVPPTNVPPSTPVPPQETLPPTTTVIAPGSPSNPSNPANPPENTNGWSAIVAGGNICVDWIVYHSNRTEAVNIFRLGELLNGAAANENLSRGQGMDVYDLAPSLSPDKAWITFASNRDGNMEIFISSVYREEILQLTFRNSAQNANPVWSPDGRYILFESNMSAGDWELYAFNVLSGTYQRLTNSPGRDINANWSPDGSRVVFQSERDGSWQIYEMTLGASTAQLLSDGTGSDFEPIYSHNGSQILFRSERDEDAGQSALYLMNRDGSEMTRISEAASHVGAHTWSPDNQLIAYQSDLSGTSQIYVYDPESETTRQVTDGALPAYAPTWKCDSSEAVIFTYDLQGKSEIFSANTYPLDAPAIDAEDEGFNLTNSEFEDGYPQGLTAQIDAMAREINAQFEVQENITVEDQ